MLRYKPLKDYVRKNCGMRLRMQPRLRDQLVDIAVEEYPFDADDDVVVAVLTARITLRARKQYGSILVLVLISTLGGIIAKLLFDWAKKRHSHRVLLYGWQEQAKQGQ